MSEAFSRAQMLRRHHRHEEAVALLLAHLGHFPEDPAAFVELALNRMEIPGAKGLALQDARQATGLMPGNSFPLALQSQILSFMHREKEALPLAVAAIELDPEDAYCWNAKTLALAGLQEWKQAEQSARETLAVDAEDETASNLLAHCLRMQNRLDESEQETRRRLARNPENAFSFANAGWAALQRRQVKEAENFFKEALRLKPDMEHARAGLKESYRARSVFYRLFLRWSFFMQRFNRRNRMAIVIGLIIVFRVLRIIAQSVNPLLVIPVAFLYYLFLFGTWLAGGLANFMLLKDPVARLALDTGEKIEGLVVGLFFFGGLALTAAGTLLHVIPMAIVGAALLLATIPSTMIFTNSSLKGRYLFSACVVGILSLASFTAIQSAGKPVQNVMDDGSGLAIFVAIMIGVIVTWIGRIPSLRNAKPE
jgi:tetratricopeptide (TPR) repeat protein